MEQAHNTLTQMVDLVLLQPSPDLQIREGFDLKLAMVYHDLGNVNRQLMDYDEAVKYLQTAIQLKTNILGEYSSSVADSLSNLSLALKLRGDSEEGDVVARKAMRIFHYRDQRGVTY